MRAKQHVGVGCVFSGNGAKAVVMLCCTVLSAMAKMFTTICNDHTVVRAVVVCVVVLPCAALTTARRLSLRAYTLAAVCGVVVCGAVVGFVARVVNNCVPSGLQLYFGIICSVVGHLFA